MSTAAGVHELFELNFALLDWRRSRRHQNRPTKLEFRQPAVAWFQSHVRDSSRKNARRERRTFAGKAPGNILPANPLSKMSSIVTLSLDRAVDFWRQLITIYLRNAIRSLSANTLIGTEVNKHGAEGLPPKVVIDLALVIERIPMRLDPYSNELAH